VLWQRRKRFTGSLQERFELCQFESSCWLAEFLSGVSASKTGGHRRPGAPPRLHRAGLGHLDREGAVRGPAGFTKSRFDGYRVQIHLANEAIKIFTRRGKDWTKRFKKVAHDAWRIKAASAVIDGEIVVPAADRSTDFSVLQNGLKGSSKTIVLAAFDLLYPNGRDIRKEPLVRRKAELKKIIGGTSTRASSVSRAWCRRCGTAPMRAAAGIAGSRRPARSARR
jgi:bifunctional non-homologous end joining protein LigD